MNTTATVFPAVHRTFDKGTDGKCTVSFYVHNGKKVQYLNETKARKWVESLPADTGVRFTAVSSADQVLLELVRGTTVRIMHANWHDMGIEKNLTPEEIVQKVAEAPADLFTEFKIDGRIAKLRNALMARNAVAQYLDDVGRRAKQIARDSGNPAYEGIEDALSKISFTDDNKGGKSRSEIAKLESNLTSIAKSMPECRLFNEIAGIKTGWLTAATIVAYSGGVSRFPTVASFWHYCGVHVVDGKMPLPKSGQPVTWSPKLRKALFTMTESILIKHGKTNPWGEDFLRIWEEEKAAHASKCQCKCPESHSKKRARWKVAKEILKRFYLAANDIELKSDQAVIETQKNSVALGAVAGK